MSVHAGACVCGCGCGCGYVCVRVCVRVPGRVGAVRENHKYCTTRGSKMATESMLMDESRERCNGQKKAAVDVWIAKVN